MQLTELGQQCQQSDFKWHLQCQPITIKQLGHCILYHCAEAGVPVHTMC
jgi:hypothetical protein